MTGKTLGISGMGRIGRAVARRAHAGFGMRVLDVYEHEPRVPSALRAMENVVLLPHLGSATVESRQAMGERALESLVAFLRGEPPPDRVV